MSKYKWRKNYSAIYCNNDTLIKGRLAFKTIETHWVYTSDPVIVPISIHSAFHEGEAGDLKMNAFLSIIKSHVRGKITILLSDKAHLNVACLKHQTHEQKAFEDCLNKARMITNRFKACFEPCHVVFWHSYIGEDPCYPYYQELIKRIYQTDAIFRKHLQEDAEFTYTAERANEFPDKSLFISKTIDDLLEQCICLLVIANKNYRYQFYPGRNFSSVHYINRTLLPDNRQISYIHVFLTIEKKTKILKSSINYNIPAAS